MLLLIPRGFSLPRSTGSVNMLLLIVGLLGLCSHAADVQTCYTDDPEQYRLYSTWTAYEDARGKDAVVEETLPGCTPVQFYMLARHGFRYTGIEEIQMISEKLPELWNSTRAKNNGSLLTCTDDAMNLDDWMPRMKVENEWFVVESGLDELRGLGERFKARYPSLFSEYDAEKFEFRHTKSHTDRTGVSAEAFVEGVFGSTDNVTIMESVAPDWLLKFYSLCEKYTKSLDTKDYLKEADMFVAGPEMQAVLDDVSDRLGVDVDYDTVMLIYETCRVEYGIYGDSPWCAALSTESLKTLEYKEDLVFYYRNGHGYELNYQQSCPLVEDVLDHFSLALDSENTEVVTRFGHMPDMNSFFARLGLFKDTDKPTASNYDPDDTPTRAWRTSLHTAMGSNIALVLYRCDNGNHQVKAFESERPITIPGCPEGSDACAYDTVTSLWQPYADECDMEELCATTDGATALSASMVLLLCVLTAFVQMN